MTTRNRVLAALPPPAYEQCLALVTAVQLEQGALLFAPDQPIEHIYFPVDAVASLIITMADGTAVESATVGNEGVVGLPVFLGAPAMPMTAFAQVPGAALRMGTGDFRALLADVDGPLADVLHRYTQTLFTQLAQNVACNRLHSVGQRCARWLLMTADRVPPGPFPLTQEFLAQMLGVRRASVSEVAGRLAQNGSITYTRGVVTVLDRERLQGASCECYTAVTDMLHRMLKAYEAAADPEGTDAGG